MTFLSRPFTSLLNALEDASSGQLQMSLEECLPYLEKLLVFKEKSPDGRSKLDSNTAPFADKNLSDGDRANVRALSDALNLDEELCVELLLRAHTEGRPVTAEHAAHIYFDERSSVLQAFIRMLYIQLGYASPIDAASRELVEQALHLIVSPAQDSSSASKTAPLARLCAIAKDTTFQALPATIATLEDENSGAVPFSHFPAAERAHAAQATFLLTAAAIGPRATPTDAQGLLTLITNADSSLSTSALPGAPSSSEFLAGLYPLCAFVATVSPSWAADARPADDAGFAALARSKELAAAVSALRDGGSGFAAVARLAFGVAVAALHDGLDGFEEGRGATALVAAAIDAGALQYLGRYAEMPCVRDAWPGVCERICGSFLNVVLRYADMFVVEYQHTTDAVRSANAWVSGATTETPASPSAAAGPSTAITLAPFAAPSAADASAARRDTPATLMRAVAALLAEIGGGAAVAAGSDRLAPELPPAALEAFVALVRFAGRTPELANAADEDEAMHGFGSGLETVTARTAYLALMRAYAKDPWSAQQTALQLRDNRTFDGYRHLTWHAAYRRMMFLHGIFRSVADDVTAEPPVATREEADDIEEAVTMAVAFMDVMRVVVVRSRAAGEAQVRASRETLRSAYEECLIAAAGTAAAAGIPNSPEELLIQVMSFAVPPPLKAAINGVLAAHAAAPSDAHALLRRLAATALVDRNRASSNLSAQLAQHSDAPAGGGTLEEMTAYVRLMNRIVATGGPELVAAEVDTLMPHMEFILTQLLAPIGKRRYATPSNQHHLAAACVRHLTLSIRSYAASAADPSSHISQDPQAAHTGSTALSHLLSPSSPLLRELFAHVLHASPTLETTAVERLTELRVDDPCGHAAESAVTALFELLLVTFDLDTRWVQLQQSMHALVDTLGTLLLRSPGVALQLMQFARYDYSPWLQAAAVRVTGTLAARDTSVTQTLLKFGDEAAALVHSFAGCLSNQAAVPLDLEIGDEWEEAGALRGGAAAAQDDAADKMEIRGLILQLMLDCSDMPFPNFAQLLLGYYVSGATDHLTAGPLPHAPSCMGALEAILCSQFLAHSCAPAFKAAWQVVHAFATSRTDGDALLRHLTVNGTLAAALQSPLWAIEAQSYEGDVARVLYCKAWILGTVAMQLLVHDGACSELEEREGTRDVLRNLLTASPADVGGGRPIRGGGLAETLLRSTLLTSLHDLQALSARDLCSAWGDEQVAQGDVEALGLAAVLDNSLPLERGGVLYYDTPHGVWLYEADAVQGRLTALKDAYLQRGDVRQEDDLAGKDRALVAALNQSARWNESQLSLGGCTFLAQSWCSVVQLACIHRQQMCAAAIGSAASGAALMPVLHELLLASLARVEAFCKHQPRAAPVGLRVGAPTTVILQLLQCAQSLILSMAARPGHAGGGGDTPAQAAAATAAERVPPRVAREVTLMLLKASRALHESNHLLDDRAEILAALHACLLSHLSSSFSETMEPLAMAAPLSPFRLRSPLPAPEAIGGDLDFHADVQLANTEAIQAEGLGITLARNMRKQLDSTLAAAAAAAGDGSAADAALTMTQAAQHTLALHALSAMLAAEATQATAGGAGAVAGSMGGQLSREGVLGAVLESLGAGTPLRLYNAPQVVRHSLALTEAHFLFIQTFATPSHPSRRAAHCRELLSRGIFSAVARSGVLHLRVPLPTTAAAAELNAALSTLRAAALRALLAVALQLSTMRSAMHELARLLTAPEQGCLGDRAVDILKGAQAQGAQARDAAQATHLVTLLALVYPHHASLEAPLRATLLKRRDDVFDTLATLCRRAAAERGALAAGSVLGPPPSSGSTAAGTGARGGVSGMRAGASDPPLTLPPRSPMAQRPLYTPAQLYPHMPIAAGGVGALTLKTPALGGADASPPQRLPWQLALQMMDFLCVVLCGSGSGAGGSLRLWPPGQSTAAAQLQSPRRDYFDVALILDLISALYERFQPLARPQNGGRHTPQGGVGASPLLRTPGAVESGTSSHTARQRHLCCQLAERAFSVVLLCLRQREAGLLGASGTVAEASGTVAEASGGMGSEPKLQASDRDALRMLLQRAATAVDEWVEVVGPSEPLMGLLRAQRECAARIQSHFRSRA